MKELTIDEIVFLWNCKYKYDHILHGFKFEGEDNKLGMSAEQAGNIGASLKQKYGDMLNG
jgi:hypothetical protein